MICYYLCSGKDDHAALAQRRLKMARKAWKNVNGYGGVTRCTPYYEQEPSRIPAVLLTIGFLILIAIVVVGAV